MTSKLPAAPLLGLHHVTAVTGDAAANLAFYTEALGLRLVKKTVNQDDTSAYHLFYGDEVGRPGTELTFFDWPGAGRAVHGVGAVSEISLRVPGTRSSLEWWVRRFDDLHVRHAGIVQDALGESLPFTDPEGQSLRLRAEGRTDVGTLPPPWRGSPASPQASIVGLSSVDLLVRHPESTVRVLTETMGFRAVQGASGWYEAAEGGAGTRVQVLPAGRELPFGGHTGAGGVHHVAFRVADAAAQAQWHAHLVKAGLPVSGIIDRYYFQSLYFREPGGVLFEIATDGPGFASDEDPAHLGERLSLPPFLEPRRRSIEAGLRPL